MTPGRSPVRELRRGQVGFTLVELLVVMVVVGVLAGIAVPTINMQRRKAYEASAKSDVKAITSAVLTQFVDASTVLTVEGSAGTWVLRRDGVPVETGKLSDHNVVSPASCVGADGNFCLSVENTKVETQFWTADDTGLRSGDCPPP